jgi:hypothetical protein
MTGKKKADVMMAGAASNVFWTNSMLLLLSPSKAEESEVEEEEGEGQEKEMKKKGGGQIGIRI